MIITDLPTVGKTNAKPYEYHDYPKALTPPAVTVRNRDHEVQLRGQWGKPLPYDGDPKGEVHREAYFTRQTYPKEMIPPQVEVQNAEEERRQLAAWHMRSEDPVELKKWPQWRFNAGNEKPRLVEEAEAASLGRDWYANIEDAMSALRERTAVFQAPEAAAGEEQDERARLVRLADDMHLKVDKRWTTEKLRHAVEGNQKAA